MEEDSLYLKLDEIISGRCEAGGIAEETHGIHNQEDHLQEKLWIIGFDKSITVSMQ